MLERNCAVTPAATQQKPATSARLVDYSPGDKPWDIHRAQAQTVEGLYAQTSFDALAGKIRGCSGFLGFAWGDDPDTGESRLKLRSARFCRVRYCPVCQWRRSLMHKARLLGALPEIMAAHPGGRWLFLTLTVRNCPIEELRETLGEMNRAWRRFVLREEFKPVLGWIRSTEVTRGKDGSAHPHFHVLMLVRPSYFTHGYVKQLRWAELWGECMRLDYVPSVDVRTAKGDAAHAAAEALKYSTKPGDLVADAGWLEELTRQTYRLRFIAAGGVLREAIRERESSEKDLLLADDPDGEKSEPELFFDWQRHRRQYEKR